MPSNSALSDPSPVRLQKPQSRLNQFWRDYGWVYLFILIPVLLFLVFTLYPVVTAFLMSFQKYKILGSDWVGLANYKYMF